MEVPLSIKNIDKKDFSLAYSFLRDAFVVSFGPDPAKWPNNLGQLSEQNYISIIQKKLEKLPDSVFHVWEKI